jgi:tetratricopeptide (TPR) repeat protein
MLGVVAVSLLVAGGAASPGRDLEQRAADLLRRTAGVPPGSAAATSLSRDFTETGAAYLAAGDPARAAELLERAYGLDVENGLALAQLTLAHVRLENFETAAFYLALAEQQSARSPPEIYRILGDVYDALHRLDDATLAWELFQRLGGDDPRTLERLARARRELSLVSGQHSRQEEEFSFYWDPVIPTVTVERVARRLSDSYDEQSRFFETRLPASQVVVLYAGRAYFSLVAVPEWVSGVFDGKIRVSVDSDGGMTPELESVLSHELAHAFVRVASGDAAPAWLHEGLAQWWEGRRIAREEIPRMLEGRAARSLEDLERNLARRTNRSDYRASYVQALALVEYLFETRGGGSIACLLRDLKEGASLSDALRRETGLTADELVRGWNRWAAPGSAGRAPSRDRAPSTRFLEKNSKSRSDPAPPR